MNKKLINQYEKETGKEAVCDKGGTIFYTLKYVMWLEKKLNNQQLLGVKISPILDEAIECISRNINGASIAKLEEVQEMLLGD